MAQSNSLPKMPRAFEYHPSHFPLKAQPTPLMIQGGAGDQAEQKLDQKPLEV